MRPLTPPLALALALAGCATAGSTGVHDQAMRVMEAPRLQRVVLDALSSRRLGLAAPRSVRIAARREVPCAVCIGATRHCIAFLSPPELEHLRAYLPHPESADTLVSAPGVDRDQGAQVLVLSQEDFRYQPDPSRANEAEPSVQEVEDRARRRVTDWLAWLTSQGALPR